MGVGLHGKYEVKGSELTLYYADGSASRGTISGKTITLSPNPIMEFWGVGSTWVKE